MDYSNYFWQGKKVRLRPLHIDDAENVYTCGLDSPSRQVLQLEIELPTSIESIKEFLAKYTDCKDVDGLIIFTIEDLEGNNVGGISFHSRNRKNGTLSLGLVIDAPYRQRGYAEDAARILFRYAFYERRYQKCHSGCVHTNEASIALHKKLGFVEESQRRRHFFLNGQYYDDLLFGLTPEEFGTNRSARD
jgi:RimJ/RimL family protein N-acetyltransferase